MPRKPRTVAEYLAPLDAGKRAALQKLRRDIQSAAPRAQECISYGIPAFRIGGRMLVAFGVGKNHCAFYCGSSPVEVHKDDLEAYDTSKGTVRFQAASPLSAALVRKLVKTQMAKRATPRSAAVGGARRRR